MRTLKQVLLFLTLAVVVGVSLFPDKILLALVKYQTSRYCQKAFNLSFSCEELVWEKGQIVFKNGILYNPGEIRADFNEADLALSLDFKARELGGVLEIKGLRIVNRKIKQQKLPSDVSVSTALPFFTLNLKTVIHDGEVFLYDYLNNSPLFQRLHFDLEHHVFGKQIFGSIAFDSAENEQKLKTRFWRVDDHVIRLNTDFQSHSLPALYDLTFYFFDAYIPPSMAHWNLDSGKITGNLDFDLYNGIPMRLKGSVSVSDMHAENIPLELSGEFDHFHAILDVDFSSVKTISGEFALQGGRLALAPGQKGLYSFWDLRNLHTTISVKEGEVKKSTVKGNFLGMDGDILLDWQSTEALLRMGFQGYSDEIATLLPEVYQENFQEAFAEDHFTVRASVFRSGEGLELDGTFTIQGVEEHLLAFGCLLGKEVEKVEAIQEKILPFSLSNSVDTFLDTVADQFCLSKKRFGWFSGKQFPLEKFLSPFLLADVRMEASGLADFQGTFDERYLVISYQGKDFQLESPHFTLCTDCIEEESCDVVAIHYLDLQTWTHIGFLPMKNASYYQKNRDLLFTNGCGMVHFENRNIHIQDVETCWDCLLLKGSLEIEIKALDDVDLIISADHISGPASDAQKILSHFSDSIFWEIPFQGVVESREEAFSFHYHFKPAAELLSGHLQGDFKGHVENPHIGCEGHVFYDLTDIKLNIEADLCAFQGIISKNAIILEGKKISLHADRLERGLKINDFAYENWEGEGNLEWHEKGIALHNFFLREKEKGECSFSGFYQRDLKIWKGNLEAFRWDFGETRSIWEPRGEIFGSGIVEWGLTEGGKANLNTSFHNLQFGGIHFGDGENLVCAYSSKNGVTIEGLEVEIPTDSGIEKYKLGRFFYDLNHQKFLFEGFDFSLPPEKLPWITDLATTLFPEKIHSSLVELVEAIKKNEPLEGRVSIEVYPDNVWVYLTLKDGAYFLSDYQFSLKNFLLLYDPQEFNIWTQVLHRENYYWIHLVTDSMTMSGGKVEISEKEISPTLPFANQGIIAEWKRDHEKGFRFRNIQGDFHGLQCSLQATKQCVYSDLIEMEGKVIFDVQQAGQLVGKDFESIMNRLSIQGEYTLEGNVAIPKSDFSRFSFSGILNGSNIHFAKVGLDAISSELEYHSDHLTFKNLNVKDWAGSLSISQADLIREQNAWSACCKKLNLEEVRISRLKSPWTRWSSRDKPFFRSLFIRSLALSDFHGVLNDPESYSGNGSLDFTNLPKKTLFTNLLFIPAEITARIGLDLTNLIPVRGTINYKISNGKIHLNEFKEMYSDSKRSRFYLAENTPAYIDLQGNLNFKLKMKQYNLLMKLAEFFTISIKGSLLKPTYTFTNQVDE